VFVGDLDGDGDNDVAISLSEKAAVSILWNITKN
jgi:hypothetical protein